MDNKTAWQKILQELEIENPYEVIKIAQFIPLEEFCTAIICEQRDLCSVIGMSGWEDKLRESGAKVYIIPHI